MSTSRTETKGERSSTSDTDSSIINLRGSTDVVVEFFHYAISSILYQRGIYPPETFGRESRYGMTVMVAKDKELCDYINNILLQLERWLTNNDVQRLVMVVNGVESGETLERWNFKVDTARDVVRNKNHSLLSSTSSNNAHNNNHINNNVKSMSETRKEIAAIIKQITSSVSFLPLLEEACVFDLLVYTSKDALVPLTWEDSDPQYIATKSQSVQLRSLNTKVHKVEAMVDYLDRDEMDDAEFGGRMDD